MHFKLVVNGKGVKVKRAQAFTQSYIVLPFGVHQEADSRLILASSSPNVHSGWISDKAYPECIPKLKVDFNHKKTIESVV